MGRNDALTGMASVQKAFALLDVVAADERGLSAKEIATALEMPLPSVYRLLKTLVESRHLVHLKEESRYALGYKLHALDASLHRQIGTPSAVARLVLELHSRGDAAAYYAVHRGDHIVVAHVVDSPARRRITPMGFGFNDAAHATAFGKILLAGMDPTRRRAFLGRQGLPPMTSNTIRTRDELELELEKVSAGGIAVEREEFMIGSSCLGAPVRNAAGQIVGSVAVSLDAADFDRRAGRIAVLLRDTADKVGRALRATSVLPQRR
ncbi:IclR family transcriptional regulator [Arthrobacter sp. CAN_C5]|uniref:IclR family transcriptional regulator n=1 Tax=Arthrobacter sp. CAN_C5 TaxID=2760706 RepID=UPI001AE58BEA|nr:IclR family transcriptional regulator [Arthrobacter sp. CAN_C5]MBP2218095.1 DNA-binding IclR family transcriptional regulator [Arthrobacter sp. CAN_C5]